MDFAPTGPVAPASQRHPAAIRFARKTDLTIAAWLIRRSICAFAVTWCVVLGRPGEAAGTLTVAMTAGDIPVTTGNPDQGFEGYRFVGYNLYDGLLLWDLSKSDRPSEIRPGLATSYEID